MVQLEILLPTKHYYCHFQCHIKCSKCPPLTCTHAFRRLVKSLTALLIGKSLRNTLWCLLGSASRVKVGSISSTRRQKLTLCITFLDCFRSLSRTASS